MYNNYKYKEMSALTVHFFFVGGNKIGSCSYRIDKRKHTSVYSGRICKTYRHGCAHYGR